MPEHARNEECRTNRNLAKCLFENEKAGHKRAPDNRGYLVAQRDFKAGEKIPIALWKGNPDSPRFFRGIAGDLSKGGGAEVERNLFGRPAEPVRSRS